MCGIAGFMGKGNAAILGSMVRTIEHRGPDDKGVWEAPGIGLGFARLSIIDLSPAGHQPMHSDDGKVSLVFNGEIYNYRQLRDELQRSGAVFTSRSDTEVIIRMYERYGEASFARLHGMFAIGLFDAEKQALFLVRDRMGEKPLYWTRSAN